MYSKSAWGGNVDPFILTEFTQAKAESDEDPIVSLVIFEWKDEDLVGVWPSEDAPKVGTGAHYMPENPANLYSALRKHSSVTMPMWNPLSARHHSLGSSY